MAVTGLGDLIKLLTDAVGIPQCPPCQQRQALLNTMFPNPIKTPPPQEPK